MREFNTEERKIISYLNTVFRKNNLPILFEAIIQNLCLVNENLLIDIDKKSAVIKIDIDYYKPGEYNTARKEVRNVNLRIVTAINIIKTLQENGLLVSYLETRPLKTGTTEYGNLIHINGVEKESFLTQIHDTKTIQDLIDFSRMSIWGGEQLSNFVKRGFKTKEEKIRSIEINVAIVALVLSTFIGVIELFHTSHEVHLLEKLYHLFKCC